MQRNEASHRSEPGAPTWCAGPVGRRELRLGIAVVALLVAGVALAAAGERSDQVLVKDINAGAQRVRWQDERTASVEYAYTDRRPRDHIIARWTLDAAGVPLSYAGRGNDDSQAPVEETFRFDGRTARWQSRAEHGERRIEGEAFYVPATPPPEILAVLARALLRAPAHHLALLPLGEARLEEAGTLELDSVDGRRIALRHYRIAGLDFKPLSIWLDAGGVAATATDWLSVMPSSWGRSVAPLLAAQAAVDGAWSAGLARQLTHAPPGDLVIRDARLFDPRDLSVTDHRSVQIRGERIVRVAADTAMSVPAGAAVLDAAGRFLMPGLWDNHQHFEGVDGALDLANGVTSARDMANDTDVFLERVARFDAGTELGPRVFKAGVIDGNGPAAAPTRMRPDTAAEALAAVDFYAAHGYGQIKIYSSAKPDLVPLIADAAHAHGLRVSGHVPTGMTLQQFLDGGVDEVQHLHYLAIGVLEDAGRATGGGGVLPFGAHAREILGAGASIGGLVDALRRRHIVLDPTVNFYEGLYSGDPAAVTPGLEAIAPRFPVQKRRQMLSGAYRPAPAEAQAYREAFAALLSFLTTLHAGGVTMIPGTDSLAGYQLHHELELYVRAGIPPAEVLRMATLTSAEVSGVGNERGVIAAGRLADMILVDGDPTLRIADIRNVQVVIKGGKRFEPAAIEAALGIAPRR